jgi:hypothetical protein
MKYTKTLLMTLLLTSWTLCDDSEDGTDETRQNNSQGMEEQSIPSESSGGSEEIDQHNNLNWAEEFVAPTSDLYHEENRNFNNFNYYRITRRIKAKLSKVLVRFHSAGVEEGFFKHIEADLVDSNDQFLGNDKDFEFTFQGFARKSKMTNAFNKEKASGNPSLTIQLRDNTGTSDQNPVYNITPEHFGTYLLPYMFYNKHQDYKFCTDLCFTFIRFKIDDWDAVDESQLSSLSVDNGKRKAEVLVLLSFVRLEDWKNELIAADPSYVPVDRKLDLKKIFNDLKSDFDDQIKNQFNKYSEFLEKSHGNKMQTSTRHIMQKVFL